MDIYSVIVRPIETEKTAYQSGYGQYTFEVHPDANKIEIKKAVEAIYHVDVIAVNVLNMPAKVSQIRGRRLIRRRPAWRKAVVTVAPGQRIEALEA